MLSAAQMEALAAARGERFDRLFLAGMIQHHEGALDMVHALLKVPGAGQEATWFDFMSEIEADQTTEIKRMRSMFAAMP